MHQKLLLACGLLLSSCAYVTEKELLEAWDPDGDGWPATGSPQDCRPNDKLYHPYAYDRRGDGCDHDCGTEIDTDGDDWPDAADCDPEDPTIYPCSQAAPPDAEADMDCDGLPDLAGKRTDLCPGLDPDYPESREPPPCDPAEGGSPDGGGR